MTLNQTQGQFVNTLPLGHQVVGATKWCIFGPLDSSPAAVRAAVGERMTRMQTDQIDLLQVLCLLCKTATFLIVGDAVLLAGL